VKAPQWQFRGNCRSIRSGGTEHEEDYTFLYGKGMRFMNLVKVFFLCIREYQLRGLNLLVIGCRT
jgi:hypothetical protein